MTYVPVFYNTLTRKTSYYTFFSDKCLYHAWVLHKTFTSPYTAKRYVLGVSDICISYDEYVLFVLFKPIMVNFLGKMCPARGQCQLWCKHVHKSVVSSVYLYLCTCSYRVPFRKHVIIVVLHTIN